MAELKQFFITRLMARDTTVFKDEYSSNNRKARQKYKDRVWQISIFKTVFDLITCSL